jgi:hypothetical protein
MNMRDKIAEAIRYELDSDNSLESFFGIADRVLDAMRDPTDEMLICMHAIVRIECDPAKREASILNDADTWRAMIDAAKEQR